MQIQITDSRLTAKDFQPSTAGSAGIDLHACLGHSEQIGVNEILRVDVGFKTAITTGWVGIITPRSGLGVEGLVLANTVGIIDSDYRGPVMVILKNTSKKIFVISPYMRIAQLIVVPHYQHMAMEVSTDPLDNTSRGTGGFGSTGM